MNDLAAVERDLVEFLAVKASADTERIEELYCRTKRRFDFRSAGFRDLLLNTIPDLFACLIPGTDDAALFARYRLVQLPYLYRMVSYEVQERRAGRSLADQVGRPEEIASWSPHYRQGVEGMWLLDYGCGTASRSFDFARRHGVNVILVDLDTMGLEFAAWRMHKHGINCRTVAVTPEIPHPVLPPCDLAALFNAIEHVRKPATVLENIHQALPAGGCLKINNIRHQQQVEWQHLTPDMKEARAWLAAHVEQVSPTVFRKKPDG